jgi:hypothetical protein
MTAFLQRCSGRRNATVVFIMASRCDQTKGDSRVVAFVAVSQEFFHFRRSDKGCAPSFIHNF